MRLTRFFALTALCALVGLSGTAGARTLTVAADLWCPFNCEPGTAAPGYMVELLEAIVTPEGHKIHYKVLP